MIVELPNDETFVFCFSKKSIIKEEDCKYYEHNLECRKKGKVLDMTHFMHTNSGRKYMYSNVPLLNECWYCLENHEVSKYELSNEAKKLVKNNHGAKERLSKWLNGLH